MSIAVIIPCFRVRSHISEVLAGVGPEVQRIYVIDDCCPEGSGDFVREQCQDNRVVVIRHSSNRGVGAATMTGYAAALQDGCEILVKVDGDGQMDPSLIPNLIAPIVAGLADYTKGNRFYDASSIREMPAVRLFGNAVLSFLTKFSSGYWDIFDPTNGFTAIHSAIAVRLPFSKISSRFFFETDMLFRLNLERAVVVDIPTVAKYGDEISNLRIWRISAEFLVKQIRNFAKRVAYSYYLRDFSVASLQLPIGLLLLFGGVTFGAWHWHLSATLGVLTPAGTVMLASLPILTGTQLLLAFLQYDISVVPRHVRQHGSAPFNPTIRNVDVIEREIP